METLMAETELTKQIKKAVRYFRPAMNSSLRTIRWAEEVQVATGGFVDVIRFEDYISRDMSYCARIEPVKKYDTVRFKDTPRECTRVPGGTFSSAECKCCVYKRSEYMLDILTTCFEVKISASDFKSKSGHNFCGNRNYYVITPDIYSKISPLVQPGIGIIVYYPESGRMITKRECGFREVADGELSRMLYNALKKWVDGRFTNG
jgi:hypothetical protein